MPLTQLSFQQKSWRLSPIYLFYFALFGTFIPYAARFLTVNGLSAVQAGIILAVVNGVNVFAPFLFSAIADRTGRRMVFIRVGYAAIGLFYCLSLFVSGFWFYLLVFGLFGVFLSAVLPQMESVTLSILGDQKHRYGQIRLWGSIGFVATVWMIGFLLDVFSVAIIPIMGTILAGLMFVSTFLIPERPRVQVREKAPADQVADSFKIDWVQVMVLLAVILFWQFSMAPYNTFFDLYMREHGVSAATSGFLISFGSFCEIAIFVYIGRLFSRYSERSLMVYALAATVVRWLLLAGFPSSFWVVFFSQSFHAITFGVVHSVVVHRIGHLFPESKASFGQGLYVAIGAGVGLSVGNLIAGALWDGTGRVYIVGVLWTLIALAISWFGIRDKKQPDNL